VVLWLMHSVTHSFQVRLSAAEQAEQVIKADLRRLRLEVEAVSGSTDFAKAVATGR